MQADNVSVSQQLVLADIREAQLLVNPRSPRPTEHNHLHAKSARRLTDLLSRVATPNQAKRAALDPLGLAEHFLVPAASLQQVGRFGDAAVNREDQAHGQLGDRLSVHARTVGHINAAP